MKKVAYICGYYNFPRGSASANYVQYLSFALRDLGYKILLITNTNDMELKKFTEKYGEEIEVKSYHVRSGKIGRYVDINFAMGKYVNKILSKCRFAPNDIIISYSYDRSINEVILSYAKKNKITSIACVVELFEKEDFINDRYGLRYKKYKYTIDCLISQFDVIFPISTYIEDYYSVKRNRVYRLPIMTDPYEFNYVEKTLTNKIKFIYPANGKMKDSILDMVTSINNLTDAELNKVEFHFCGVKKSIINGFLSERLRKQIGNAVVIHDWMQYEELIALYQSVDFLLLARKKCQMTLANFPSKVPEAMCYGVVPVVSKVGDYTSLYLVDKANSIIFDGYDAKACEIAIRRCLELSDTERKQLQKAARQTAIDVFYYKVWEELIWNAINMDSIE